MIPLSELTKRRLKSYDKFLKSSKPDSAVVLRLDSLRNHIDLSRRRVSRQEAFNCEHRYQKAKIVHSILSKVSVKAGENIETLYKSIIWPLEKIYGSAYIAIKLM